MAKSKRVRITKNDRVKIKKLERNVLRKQQRIRKNYGIEEWFPFRPFEDIQSGTRSQLNKYYEELQSFTNRNNHRYKRINNIVVPYDDYRELVRNIEKTNRNRAKARNKVNKYIGNPKKGPLTAIEYYSGVLGSQKMHFLENQNKEALLRSINSKERFQILQNRFRDLSRDEYFDESLNRMKQNYIKAIYNPENGLLSEANPDILAEIVNRINNLSDMQFYAWYLSDEDLDFVYIYEDIDKQNRAQYLLSKLEQLEQSENET